MEIESDGVMDGRHSTFENVFEMRQKVEPRRRRDPSNEPPQREREFVRNAQSRIGVVSIFKLIQTRRGHILRSPARSDECQPNHTSRIPTDGRLALTLTGIYRDEIYSLYVVW